jgi:F-type H+-transporting ATPase subunit b
MEMITSLGLDWTMFAQMGIFLVVFLVLKNVLFEPYFAAFHERRERTVGQAEAAERYVHEAKELEAQYSAKAQEINAEFRAIYDKTRSETQKEYDRVIQEARSKAKTWTEQARTKIEKEVRDAKQQMSPDVPVISQLIIAKMLGKEASR